MPSFWNFLCFPRRRYKTNDSKQPKRKRKEKPAAGTATIDGTRFYKPPVTSDTVRTLPDYHRNGSAERLVDDERPKKRRRVQDIFKTHEDFGKPVSQSSSADVYNSSPHYSKHSNNYSYSLENYSREPKRFGSSHATSGNTHGNERRDSMYGYVPKAMQDVYASTVLEGGKIDDFFGNCRTDSWMNMFASAEKVLSEQGRKVESDPPIEQHSLDARTQVTVNQGHEGHNLIDFNSVRGQARSENDLPCRSGSQVKSRNPPTGYMADLFPVTNNSPSVLDHHDDESVTAVPFQTSDDQLSQDSQGHEEMQCNSSWNTKSNTETSGKVGIKPAHRQFERLVKSGDVLY